MQIVNKLKPDLYRRKTYKDYELKLKLYKTLLVSKPYKFNTYRNRIEILKLNQFF
jgi:hypothetical protein